MVNRWAPRVAVVIGLLISVAAFPQDDPTRGAQSSRYIYVDDYMPVPGDIYTVVVDFGGEFGESNLSEFRVMLQDDYTFEVPFLGRVSVAGLNYRELREFIISSLREDAPPSQYIEFALTAPAFFDVTVFGVVPTPGRRPTSSVTRLAEFITSIGGFLPGASRRRVRLVRGDSATIHDFVQYRVSDGAEVDPYLRRGDRVIIPRVDRTVQIQGAVAVPGSYEVLAGETLADLYDLAGGLLPISEADKVSVLRLGDSGGYAVRELSGVEPATMTLEPGDIIQVPSKSQSTERIVVEGALYGQPVETGATQQIPSSSIRVTIPHQPGLTVLKVLERLGGPTPFARGDDSYIARSSSGERIPIPDFTELWEEKRWERDIVLEPGDYLVVPIIDTRVTVGGAVRSPNSFPYVAGATVAEYLFSAGGVSPTAGNPDDISLIGRDGSRRPVSRTETITPGAVLYVGENTWTRTERILNRTLVVAAFITAVIELTQLVISFSGSF